MPGFVKYWYKEGVTSSHTENYFIEHEILLTEDGVIIMNSKYPSFHA